MNLCRCRGCVAHTYTHTQTNTNEYTHSPWKAFIICLLSHTHAFPLLLELSVWCVCQENRETRFRESAIFGAQLFFCWRDSVADWFGCSQVACGIALWATHKQWCWRTDTAGHWAVCQANSSVTLPTFSGSSYCVRVFKREGKKNSDITSHRFIQKCNYRRLQGRSPHALVSRSGRGLFGPNLSSCTMNGCMM